MICDLQLAVQLGLSMELVKIGFAILRVAQTIVKVSSDLFNLGSESRMPGLQLPRFFQKLSGAMAT